MNIQEKENDIFKNWEGNRKGFVKDGVVSEKDYLESDPKIVFILKEVNDPDGGGWDLREYLRNGGRSQTWDNVVRWVHGIHNIKSDFENWNYYLEKIDELRKEMLPSICAINLKKSPGTHTTDKATLSKVANDDKELLIEQFSFYDPDWTICGGTGDLFIRFLGVKWKDLMSTTRGIKWFERAPNKYVVLFVHPEARVDDSLLLYSLLDAIKEIKNNN